MKNKTLSVRLHGEPLGILEQTLSGKMKFTYDSSATRAISINMPLQTEAYDDQHCEAYFGGLLPESEHARKAIAKRYRISSNNNFALLKAIGCDCAGAVSMSEIDEPITSQQKFKLEGKIVSENELYNHIKSLPEKPLFMDFEGLRLSLAGVQDKAAVCIINNHIALPVHGCPTTHILKPAIKKFEGIIENEYFCLKIASHIGLPVPSVEIRQVKDIPYLLIKRYDRKIENNQIEHIHQEDFCQALGIVSSRKYQNEGGPGFKECFDLLNNSMQPAIDRNFLISAVIFNYLMGNMDAHGKNFSLLHHSPSIIKLAPFYDLICTSVYSHLTSKMAMKIGSKYEADYVLPRHWEQLCNNINYSFTALKRTIIKQAEAMMNAAELQRENLIQLKRNVPVIDEIIKLLDKKITNILRQFNE